MSQTTLEESSRFKLVLLIAVAIFFFCGLGSLVVVLVGDGGRQADQLLETFSTVFKISTGALLGLLGGKVA